MAQTEKAWSSLSGNYDTPDGYMLLSALDPALGNAEFITGAATLVASAMRGFASSPQELEPRRQQLIADTRTFNAKECPSDDAGCATHRKEEEEIQQHINALAEEYHQRIRDYITHLAGINSEGSYSDPNAPDLGGYVQGQGAGLGTSFAQSRERVRTRVHRSPRLWTNIGDTRVMQWLAKCKWLPSRLGEIKGSIHLSLPPKTTTGFDWNFKGPVPPENFLQRLAANFKEMFLGPSTKPRVGPLKLTITMDTEQGTFGIGVEKAERTMTSVTKTGRALGHGFFALGTAMTFNSEYQKTGAALKEQQPGLSGGERFLKAGEEATIRTESQIGAAAGMDALINSVLSAGGTTTDFAVSLGADALMMAPTDNGKGVGDRFADLGGWDWSSTKGTGGNFLNTIRGFFEWPPWQYPTLEPSLAIPSPSPPGFGTYFLVCDCGIALSPTP